MWSYQISLLIDSEYTGRYTTALGQSAQDKIPTFAGIPLTKTEIMDQVQEFNEYRAKMNEVILGKNNKVINRLFNLDTNTYAEGALPVRTKEMLGLVASMVLRCDDCIKYHLGKCFDEGITTEEMYEIFAVANIVGGTIVIPHTRRAAEYWEVLNGRS